jgi:hypothetical protein
MQSSRPGDSLQLVGECHRDAALDGVGRKTVRAETRGVRRFRHGGLEDDSRLG